MENNECKVCFSDIQKKGNELFTSIEAKHDLFLTKMETRHRDLTIVNMSILGMFGLAIAYIFVIAVTKANKEETLSIKQAEQLEKTMTKYYDQRYSHADGSKIDESTYKWHIQTIFESNSRSAELIKN